jgi:Ca-activated chloride channel family protein
MRSRFGNLDNLERISRISWGGRASLKGTALALGLVLMVLTLAQPRMVSRELRPIPTPTDIVFMLDISPSMYARDNDPTRLQRAERVIQRFLLLKQPQDRYGLVVFNWNSVVLSYFTSDPQSVLLYFDYMNQQNEPQLGTNMAAALISALRIVATDNQYNPEIAKGRRRIFILLSDGDDSSGAWSEVLRGVINAKIKVYTFGLGSANGAYVPLVMAGGINGSVVKYIVREDGARIISEAQSKTLREISEKTSGLYWRGESNRQVDEALDELLVRGRPVAGYSANPVRKDLYTYFLFSAFALLVLGVFL